jgi:MYXO-CTERM domain-containing protein
MPFASSALLTLVGLAVCDAHAQPAAHAVFEDSSPRAFELHRPDARAGALIARGFAVGPFSGEPDRAALAFVDAYGASLGLPAVQLEPSRTSTWRDRTRVHLQQHHAGVPVAGAVAVVTLDGAQRVVMVNTQLRGGLTVDTTPAISREAATASALEALGEAVIHPARVGLWVLPDARGGRLVWRVELWPESHATHWRATIDARSGAVLTLRDMRQHALADVWEHNADNSELVEVELHGDLDSGDGTLTDDLAVVHTMAFEDGDDFLTQTAMADEAGDFFYEPDDEEDVYDDAFAEVNAYWHVADIRTWFAEEHGHSWSGPVDVTVNYRDSASGVYDNAYFTKDYTGDYVIALGQGNVDLAYDADVIQHEFGHGVVDDLCDINSELDYPISFDEYGLHAAPHGVNEGMADYWSSTFQGDPCTGEYFGSAFGMECLRDLDNDNVTPDHILGEAHEDGNIVGGALWEVREVIGVPMVDEIIYGALGSLTPAPTFLEYATAVDEYAAAAGLDQATLDAVAEIFERRGWYKSHRAIEVPDGEEEQGLFLGADLLAGFAGSSACTLARTFDGGLLFPLPFQFSFTVPTDVEVEAVNIDFGLEKASIPNVLDDDDLQYSFYLRQGELITFEEYNLYQLIGFDFTILTDVLDYDLEIDDQPESVRLEVDDPDYPLVPGETYYFDLAGMNCPIMSFAITVDFEVVEPVDEEEPGGCGCASGGAAGSALGLLGVLGLVGLARRRR